MSGSVFSAMLVAAIGIAAVIFTGGAFIWFLPVVVVTVLLLLASPVRGMFSGRMVSTGEPSGVPSTSAASYDPTTENRG